MVRGTEWYTCEGILPNRMWPSLQWLPAAERLSDNAFDERTSRTNRFNGSLIGIVAVYYTRVLVVCLKLLNSK